MIPKEKVVEAVKAAIEQTDLFIVDISIDKTNRIVVEIDSLRHGMDIDTCAMVTRRIEEQLDRDVEDYELEVGSAGLTSPFKVREQYIKNIGNRVEVLTTDSRKLRGELAEVGDDGFTIVVKSKERIEGQKKPVEVERPVTLTYDQARKVTYLIEFK